MDRIRLSNGIPYPFIEIEQTSNDLIITFYKTVEPKTIRQAFLDVIKLENRKGKCLSIFKGYDTIIQIKGSKMHLRKYQYSEIQLVQQSITDSELAEIEAQQDMTDLYIVPIENEQEATEIDLNEIESQQDVTESDLEQIEQGQALTEYELELIELM